MPLTLPRTAAIAVVMVMTAVCASACSQASRPAPSAAAQPAPSESAQRNPTKEQPASKDSGYAPPTAEEMAPMPAEYLAELAKIHEPPEMTGKPMQVRKTVSPSVVKLANVIAAVGSPEKATHQERATTIRELLEILNSSGPDDGVDRITTYGAIAVMACLDGADPQTVVGYANNAIGDEDDDALALRARMYLQAGDRKKALDDLEKIMVDDKGRALVGGDADPRKDSTRCGWSTADLDALGDDPRALAAKGLYLSSFIAYNAEQKGTVKESTIQDLYARSATSWHSPIPHFLDATTVDGLGSQHVLAGAGCMRANARLVPVPETLKACEMYDEGIRQQIRELTMALVVDPTFAAALSARAGRYLDLAQSSYADGKPSRQLFELAIKDYNAALAADVKNQHTLYCDRAIALASIGRYQEAASGYLQGMKYAKNGIEDSPFVYEQLAGVYMKLEKFSEAAEVLTQAIINSSGSGMDAVILFGGISGFRALYPEYALLPDEILAEDVRRRYQTQFPSSWDADFISKAGDFKGKIMSTVLADLYALRGDAYMKAGRRAEALADYRRLKSDAWSSDERLLPRHFYFNERGKRNFAVPGPWPPPPPAM
jgi:tetratricopeptide (TPR) repeat protein